MTYAETTSTWRDVFVRFFKGSRITLFNIKQCPCCSGTDRAAEVYEGWGTALYHCSRCDKEWWT